MDLKIHAGVYPHSLGRVIHRITAEIRKWAPEGVTFTRHPQADLEIVHVVGVNFEHEALHHHRFVLIMHTWKTAGGTPAWWHAWFRKAALVVSFHDLPASLGANDFAFHRMPWGVDGTTFPFSTAPKTHLIMTTGYDPAQEAIRECWEAAIALRERAVHLGGPISGMPSTVDRVEHVPDATLAAWYGRCAFVSGLRRIEGFELPALEGLCCGARPIVFDAPHYRQWFDGHAVFVPEVGPDDLRESLIKAMDYARWNPWPVTEEERQSMLARFSWSMLIPDLWQRIIEAIMEPA